jgi:hypothetical protein
MASGNSMKVTLLKEVVCRAVGLKSDENANLLNVPQGGIESVKTTDEEVPDQAVKKASVFAEQDSKAIAQRLAGLVRYER